MPEISLFATKNKYSDKNNVRGVESTLNHQSNEPCCLKKRPDYVGHEGIFEKVAVASDTKICSDIAASFLADPAAHIVDAAIATMLAMGVANYHNMGIGGGAFFNIYIKEEEKIYQVDCRETAPAAAHAHMFDSAPVKAERGPMAVGVPGELAGYWELHQKFGKLPWKDLFRPAIDMCRYGHSMGRFLHWAAVLWRKWIETDPLATDTFIDPFTNELREVGDLVTFQTLANTLEEIAEKGADHFYRGKLAEDIVDELQESGCIITKEDLCNYKAEWREPVMVRIASDGDAGEYIDIAAMPPPSSGALVAFIIKALNGYDLQPGDLHGVNQVQTQHWMLEVIKFAYGARAKMGDEQFVTNTRQLIESLTSETFCHDVRNKIDDDGVHPADYYGDSLSKMTGGTSHLSLIAANGDAVSATSTINHYFGAKIIGGKTGICYNGVMDDFSLPVSKTTIKLPQRSVNNYIEPGKRAMSTMCPILVLDHNKDALMSIGGSGGSRIITAVAQVMARTLLMKESLKSAVDAARIYEQWMPHPTICDKEIDQELMKKLVDLGHELIILDETKTLGAILQVVQRKNGRLHAYSDTKKDGCSCGV